MCITEIGWRLDFSIQATKITCGLHEYVCMDLHILDYPSF